MPVQPTYPGVYIEELSSGVRTITGVATSITAFVGRALQGPVNEPTTITSFSDFERSFGGLWIDSTMSYAVRDFYLNGGSQAIIVRLERNAVTAEIDLPVEGPPGDVLTLLATSPGAWGSALSVSVNYNTADPTAPLSPPEPPDDTLFNLVVYMNGAKAEEFLNVSLDDSEIRYLPRVLEQGSSFIQIGKDSLGDWIVPDARPAATDAVDVTVEGDDGDTLTFAEYLGDGSKTGIYALKQTDLFNLLCIPPPVRTGNTDPTVYQNALKVCNDKRAMLIVDPPFEWGASSATAVSKAIAGLGTLGLSGKEARNAALYFPRVKQVDTARGGQVDTFVPSGIIAGIMAKTDTDRGVWKAPAGIDAALNGIQGLQVNLTDPENGQLNPLGINCLRSFPVTGRVVWGARTLRGADQLADEYKYISVRRTALFIEESLYRGTQWVVFEPNDEPLWAQIRLNVGAFMHNLFRQGAFQGATPREAYLVKCDKETTTQNDINLGIVNILVGFAPLKPAEFVIIKIQQLTGQIDT
ncbi:MAG: phage tail sheath family protein [Williamsia sp.]|nr:phage tail sheath family protein [Williamsia sp.]